MNLISECPLIVTSCDRYSDAWHPLFTLLFRYWNDCPFPIYLISNYLKYPDSRVTTVQCGEDRHWGGNWITALKAIGPSKSILYMQEDFFMKRKVDTEMILGVYDYFLKKQIDHVRLRTCRVKPEDPWDDDSRFTFIPHGQTNRVGFQAGFWKRESFEFLLKDKVSATKTELNSHKDSEILAKRWNILQTADEEALPYFRTAIFKNRWVPAALELCKREGIKVDTSKRRIAVNMNSRSKRLNN